MIGATTLKNLIKAEASRLGFFLSGVAPAAPPPHYPVFERWIAAGRQAKMDYLATERSLLRRGDPRQILPEARSILSLAVPYTPPNKHLPEPDTLYGRIAGYALGPDYHDVLTPRLAALVETIETQVERPILTKGYVDTGPVLERDFAQQAGLGWIGKNTCLIHPRYGSYFLLAEIILNVELEPDPPFPTDHCGSCTRCIDACPTGCILPDRTIDAGRCISYLTIENKGAIPAELRPAVGNWAFGCDICQTVCPWNQRFATLESDTELAPEPGIPNPNLRKEIHLTEVDFKEKFRKSPIRRAKRRGYLRNVAVALGNSRDPAAIPDLAYVLLNESEPLVRAHAAWALGQIGTARHDLEEALKVEEDAEVIEEIGRALGFSDAHTERPYPNP